MRGRVEEVRDMVHEEQISKKEIASGETVEFNIAYSRSAPAHNYMTLCICEVIWF